MNDDVKQEIQKEIANVGVNILAEESEHRK